MVTDPWYCLAVGVCAHCSDALPAYCAVYKPDKLSFPVISFYLFFLPPPFGLLESLPRFLPLPPLLPNLLLFLRGREGCLFLEEARLLLLSFPLNILASSSSSNAARSIASAIRLAFASCNLTTAIASSFKALMEYIGDGARPRMRLLTISFALTSCAI